MAESSLSLGYPDIRRNVGDFLGIGRDPTNWVSDDSSRVEDMIGSGLRQFYHNAQTKEGTAYRWNFLWPVTSLTTTSGTSTQDMPDDFGGMEDTFTWAANNMYPPIKIVGEGQLREWQQYTSSTGKPLWCALRYKAQTGAAGQKWEVLFYPTPDATYTLTYRYLALANMISATLPYPKGGMAYAEAAMQSCLSVAEFKRDDAHGPQHMRYMELLGPAIAADRDKAPETYGYNADWGMTNRYNGADPRFSQAMTYNSLPVT